MRTRGGLGMVLHAKEFLRPNLQALAGMVVEVQVGHFDAGFLQAVDVHAESVVLGGYRNVSGLLHFTG